MKNRKIKSLLSIVLCIMLVLSSVAYADTVSTQPSNYADIIGSKYETQLREWISNDFIKGYPDGSFKPQNQITRSEFMAMVNRSYGFTDAMEIKYSDVNKNNWYYKDAAIATKAGFIQGANGKLMPLNNISRQEMAVILSRLTKNEKAAVDNAVVNSLTDAKLLPSWSKAAISVAMKNKLFDGFVDKTFNPTEKISRLEAVVTLDRAFRSMYKDVYASKGTFGPETGMRVLDGSVVVIAPDVTLRNTTINGDLILRETIGDGNVYLDNVVVKGETIVKGGGANSIVIKNSTLGKVLVIKEGNTVRIVATGTTTIDTVNIGANAKLEEYELTGTGFNDVIVLDDIPEGANVIFEGNFDDVQIDSPNINVAVESGTIESLTLAKEATNTNLSLAEEASVTSLTLDVATKVTGTGAIGTANINASGTVIEQKPTKTNTAEGVEAEVNGGKVTGSQPPASSGGGGGGGGGGSSNSAPVASNVTITGEAVVGATLTGNYAYSDADNNTEGTSIFKWYRGASADGTGKAAIEGATNKTYTIQASDKGMYLFFEVTPKASVGTTTGNAVVSAASNKIIAVYEEDAAAVFVVAENFNTHAGTDYKGLNVGYKLVGLNNLDIEKVEVKLFNGATELAKNTSIKTKHESLGAEEKQFSTPFIIVPGTYTEEYWTLSAHTMTKTTKPTKAVITITDESGNVYIIENGNLVEPNGVSYISLFAQIITGNDALAFVKPQDFGVMQFSGINGYSVGFELQNGVKAKDIYALEVSLYKGDILLATNTSKNIMAQYPDASQLSSPFNVNGTFDGSDNSWTYGAWLGKSNDVPTKTVIKVTDIERNVYVIENNNLSGDASLIYTYAGVAAAAFVVPENFNTHLGADYRGLNVGYKLVGLNNLDIEKVEVKLFNGATELAKNTSIKSKHDELGTAEKQFSTPFIVVPGTYREDYWALGTHTMTKSTKPTKTVITITDEEGNVYIVENSSLVEPNGITYESLFEHIVTGDEAREYVQTQDFGYWPANTAYNVGFKLNLDKISYDNIEKIEVVLVDAAGLELATRTATGAQIDKLKADDVTYGDLDGQLSAAFIKRTEAASNEYWNSTVYDFTTPSKAVVRITTDFDVYIVESGPPTGVPAEVTITLPEDGFTVGDKGEFTITTKANSYAGTMVIGNSTFANPEVIESLEYYEPSNKTWYPLTGDFGPSTGFPLADASSRFRVSFNTDGSYEFIVNIREAADHNKIVASKAASFVVKPEPEDSLTYVKGTLGEWKTDRTEPALWDIAGNWITLMTKTEPANNWYAWQGRKATSENAVTSHWKVETQIELTEALLERDGVRTSMWLNVLDPAGKNIDWAILQFNIDNSTHTKGWQYWDSTDSGKWLDINGIPTTAGIYKLAICFDDGKITQYINGEQVNQYDVDAELSSVKEVIFNSYSFGQSYVAKWKVPTVKYVEQYPVGTKFISTEAELNAAIANQQDNQTWVIADGIYNIPRTHVVGTTGGDGTIGTYLNISANNLTIIGEGNPTIATNEKGTGNWQDQQLVVVKGNNVKIEGVNLIGNISEYQRDGKLISVVNKIIEVFGDNFTLKDSTVTPREGYDGGTVYFSCGEDKNATIENVTLERGRISLSGATGLELHLKNVEINFTGHLSESIGYLPIYKLNNASTATVAENVIARVGTESAPYLQETLNNVPKGTTVELAEGTYNVPAELSLPDGVILDEDTNNAEVVVIPEGTAFVKNVTEFNAALSGNATTINMAAGNYPFDSQIRITKAISIIGTGDSTVITKGSTAWTNTTGSKGYAPLITIHSGSNAVTLENIRVTGAEDISMSNGKTDYGSGINVVSSSNVTLNNVTSTDNAAAGLIVNSSTVTANNLNTSGNGWYGVNVDQADSGAASFTLTGEGVIGESIAIKSDKTEGATVNAVGYIAHKVEGTDCTIWVKDSGEEPVATPKNLNVVYNAASENIAVSFMIDNALDLQPIADADSEAAVFERYEALKSAATPADISATARAIGNDIIIEYYYMNDGNKVYLKTSSGSDLIKVKYWQGYLNANGNGIPYWTGDIRTIVPANTLITTYTNPDTQGNAVESGWLKAVEGKDLYVKVTILNNGNINSTEKAIAIPAATPMEPSFDVEYYTGIGFNKSDTPVVDSEDGKVVNQEIKVDGSIEISVTSPANTYLDAGFVMNAGTLGELGSITVNGTGAYGLNLYFDLDGNRFFNWNLDGTFAGVGGDAYALYSGPYSNDITINGSSSFGLQGQPAGSKYSYTVNELKEKYPASTPIGIWIGVTRGGSEAAGTKSAVINSVTVESVATEANVESLDELKAALGNASITTINITGDFETTEKILVNRAVEINGGDKTIEFEGDVPGWQGNYVLHVYNTIGVTISNIKLTGADGALLVNGSEVALTGAVDVSNNEFGGIEISKGTAPGLSDSVLTVTGTLVNDSEQYAKPTLWLVNGQGRVEGANVPVTTNTTIKADQTQYYMIATNAEEPTPVDTTAPVVEGASLVVDEGLIVEFSINEAIDLSKEADIIISYFTENENGELTAISNTMNEGNPLVKNKLWDGYLWDKVAGINYSKGEAKVERYVDLIPANTVLQSLVRQGYHENGDMNYVNIDWTQPATYVVKIEVKDNVGNASEIREVRATVAPPADTTAPVISDGRVYFDGVNRINVEFKINEDINLALESNGNIVIRYGTIVDEQFQDLLRGDGTPIIKNKYWDGYLNGPNSEKYSQGIARTAGYLNIVPANTLIQTTVDSKYDTMNYADKTWNDLLNQGDIVVRVEITDNSNNITILEINSEN